MRWVGALVLLLGACSGSERSRAIPDRVKVSAHTGLLPMTPDVRGSVTSHLFGLVFGPPLDEYVEKIEREGRTVRLLLREESAIAAETLASIDHPALVSTRIEGRAVFLTFDDDSLAATLTPESDWLPVGPYEVDSYVPDSRMTLKRKQDRQPRFIDVENLPTEDEEWRRLMAGEADVMAIAFSTAKRQLSHLSSVRLVPVAQPLTAALWFRPGGPMGDLARRRALAAALKRAALAFETSGSSSSAVQFAENRVDARDLLSGLPPLKLVVVAAMPDLVRTAVSIQQQLALVDVDVEILSLSEVEALKRLQTNDYDIFLMHGEYSLRYGLVIVNSAVWDAYNTPELQAAVAAKDEAAVARILERDLPFTMLFKLDEVVVVRSTLCNVHPIVSHDLSWLADVRWCKPGEVE